jgi:hypothetical protein
MSYTAIEGGGGSTQELEYGPLRALFFVRSVVFCRAFAGLLAAMLAAGHRVVVAFDHVPAGLPVDDVGFLEGLHQQHSTFSYRVLPARTDLWRIPASAVRRSLDYIRYLSRDYAETDPRREEARARAPRAVRALLFLPPFRWTFGRRFVAWLLRRLEAGMPIPRTVRGFIAGEEPDIALVSPLVDFGSSQGDYLRAAELAGIPSIFIVWGDDDLSAKGAIRDLPTLTITWSERQADEAVRLQGLPSGRVVVTEAEDASGAPGPPPALAVVERTAVEGAVPRGQGRILRPLLRLLTPLLVVALPIVRPRSSARAAVRIVRQMPVRRRKRKADRARRRDRERKARVDAGKRASAEARDQKRARTEAARADKAQRAEAKEQERAHSMAMEHDKRARARDKDARAETKHRDKAGDKWKLQQAGPTTRTRGPVGEPERDLGQAGQGAQASGEGTGTGGQAAEGTGADDREGSG